jgi:hypothetical protein
MSTTFGPPAVLDGPLPAPYPYGLLAAATVVPETDERWANGARVWGYPAGPPETFDPCSAGSFRVKEEGGIIPLPLFGAYTAYLAITCTARGIGSDSEFQDRARLAFLAVEQYAAELELARGLTMPANPYLGDANADVLGGAAVGPEEGLALLEGAIGSSGRAGMIHAGRDTASAWGTTGGLRVQSDRLLTFLGTPVAAGGGYQGVVPDGEAALSADQGYAFATGPVQVRRSAAVEILPGTLAEALDRENNVVTFRAERNYLVDWDTQLQAAVLVDRSL